MLKFFRIKNKTTPAPVYIPPPMSVNVDTRISEELKILLVRVLNVWETPMAGAEALNTKSITLSALLRRLEDLEDKEWKLSEIISNDEIVSATAQIPFVFDGVADNHGDRSDNASFLHDAE